MPGVGPAVLVVTDDVEVSLACEAMLAGTVDSVHVAATSEEAATILTRRRLDLVIADLRDGHLSAFDVIRSIRARSDIPVLALASAHGDPAAQCLELGADDCVEWPTFDRELRVRVRIRSAHDPGGASTLVYGDLAIDTRDRSVMVAGDSVHLTDREFDLLVYLARIPGRIATADQLLDEVWRSNPGWQTSRTVAEHVYRLRKKLEADPAEPRRIITHRGRGYCFASPELSVA